MDSSAAQSRSHSVISAFAIRAAVLFGTGILLVTANGCSSNKEPVADTPAGVTAALAPPKIPADVLARENAIGQARSDAMRQAAIQAHNSNSGPPP